MDNQFTLTGQVGSEVSALNHGFGVLVVCGVILAPIIGIYRWCNPVAQQKVDSVGIARKIKWVEKPDTSCVLDTIDQWGNHLRVDVVDGDTKKTYNVVSSGPDGKFNTTDDIIATKTDYKKTKLIGRWLGKKSKEFVDAFRNGDNE